MNKMKNTPTRCQSTAFIRSPAGRTGPDWGQRAWGQLACCGCPVTVPCARGAPVFEQSRNFCSYSLQCQLFGCAWSGSTFPYYIYLPLPCSLCPEPLGCRVVD